MDEQDKATVCIVLIIGLTLSMIAWSISYYYTEVGRTAIEAGLIEIQIDGTTNTRWGKEEGR